MKKVFIILSFIMLLSACKEKDNPIIQEPSMSGKWVTTWVGAQVTTSSMELIERRDSLFGDVNINDSHFILQGSIYSSQIILNGFDQNLHCFIKGTTTKEKSTFSGTLELYDTNQIPEKYLTSLIVKATKQ